MFQKILCPVDFSACSLNAFFFACEIAEKNQSKFVHLVTVQDGAKLRGIYNHSVFKLLSEGKFDQALSAFARDGLSRIGTSVEIKTEVIQTDRKVSTTLIEKVEKEGFDLVCMGTEGVNKLKKHVLGSTTKNVLEKVSCHLLAVPLQASFHGIEKIAFGVDIMYFPKNAFQEIYELSEKLGARLHLFDVNIANNPLLEEQLDEVKQELAHFSNLDFTLIDAMEVVDGIIKFSKTYHPDIIVVLSKNYSYLDRLFERSYTEKLILHTDVPVLAIKYKI
ncbi:MAG: universal stress protein [Saprospirales bacterium]|nr:MAG: universal stress protein [Saprospirales bacterium]